VYIGRWFELAIGWLMAFAEVRKGVKELSPDVRLQILLEQCFLLKTAVEWYQCPTVGLACKNMPSHK
jgi:hypothetical protein